jgi:murein DD-endopeptidase MepM/ murein hydrolase activator NlpD
VTVARSGDTALVVDTSAHDSSRAATPSVAAPDDTVSAVHLSTGGSATPAVGPADLESLKAERLIIPVAGVEAKDLVDSFDDKRGSDRHHNALDIKAKRNTPVLAAVSGVVIKLHNSVAGGLTIYMSDPAGKYVMMYGHLDSYRPGLKDGDRVKQGEIIGFVGSTGNANPLAPHLHFQVTRNDNMKEWWKGTPINPFLVFRPAG